jgi:hypothetical protein
MLQSRSGPDYKRLLCPSEPYLISTGYKHDKNGRISKAKLVSQSSWSNELNESVNSRGSSDDQLHRSRLGQLSQNGEIDSCGDHNDDYSYRNGACNVADYNGY